jgi:hypothetical protein
MPTSTAYPEVPPGAGMVDLLATTYTDSQDNKVDESVQETVTAVNPDGSYTLSSSDPSGNDVTVDGITYRYDPRVSSYDSNGRVTGYTVVHPTGTVSCQYSDFSAARPSPLHVGDSWSYTYTFTCSDQGPVQYTVAGQVLSAESVTVPAGTFDALKISDTVSWTSTTNEHVVESNTRWVDPANAFFTLQTQTTYARSGNVPATYVTAATTQLQSRTN